MNQPTHNNINLRAPVIQRRPVSELPDIDGVPPLIKRLYAARGYNASDISALSQMPSYTGLAGIDTAAELIADAIEDKRHIRIVGDYDVDGATSTTLVYEALGRYGATHVTYVVPDRVTQGYGLTPPLAEEAAINGAELLITVDNGISAHEGVQVAREAGLQVVVTDHHAPGQTLPEADAIVNPVLEGQDFPCPSLAGVGVAFYVMAALRAELERRGAFADRGGKPNISDLLELVALGTVADVVKLDALNRVLVETGLKRMRSPSARPGIKSLIRVANRSQEHLVSSDLAFSVAPRLNAAGRLEDMRVGIECLLSRNAAEAETLALTLDNINRTRREKEQEMRESAVEYVDTLIRELDNATIPDGLCVFESSWHEGIVGLVAGKLKEKYHRPTVAFAPGADGMLKGSARSIPGIHVRDVLADIAANVPGLLPRFGGHAMAAGMSIEAERLDEFRQRWSETIQKYAEPGCFEQVILTDGELAPDEFSMESALAIESAGPWGQGFPEPLFDGILEPVNARIVGEKHLRLDLRDPRSDKVYQAIAFNHEQLGLPDKPTKTARWVFRLGVNRFRGKTTLQLMIEGFDLALAGT